MSRTSVIKPIFVIGTGRSGSTVISEAISAHKSLAWFPNYMNFFPAFTLGCFFLRFLDLPGIGFYLRGKKKQDKRWTSFLRKCLPHIVEAYPLWQRYCGEKIKFDYLLDKTANSKEQHMVSRIIRQIMILQNKSRFFAKFTGPPRICFLNSIFHDSFFIHILRDPRAVVRSLLNVTFWKKNGGLKKPWWINGPEFEHLGLNIPIELYPLKLAAIQWKNIIEITWQESNLINKKRYIEIRYEDFVQNPHRVMSDLLTKVELPQSKNVNRYLDLIGSPSDMNFKYKEIYNSTEIDTIDSITAATAKKAGYIG